MLCFHMTNAGRHRTHTGNVIVSREKHGTYYWPANTPEEFAASCAAILKQRMKDGHYVSWGDPPTYDTDADVLTDEQYEALPEGRVKKLAKEHRDSIVQRRAEYKRNNHNVKVAQEVVESPDIAKLIPVNRKSNGDLLRYETLASRVLAAFEDIDKIECVSLEDIGD